MALTQRSEEPAVLAASVSLLESLLDSLLGILTLGNFLESVVADNALESFELECVTGGHEVVVVDDLDERLDAAALLDLLGAHATGYLGGVALDTGDESIGEGVGLGAGVLRLDNDDLSNMSIEFANGQVKWCQDRKLRCHVLPVPAKSWCACPLLFVPFPIPSQSFRYRLSQESVFLPQSYCPPFSFTQFFRSNPVFMCISIAGDNRDSRTFFPA